MGFLKRLFGSDSGTAETIFDVIEEGEVQQIRSLLRKHRSLANATLPSGHNLLHSAALYGREDLIRVLKEAGVPINKKDPLAGDTPLHLAVRSDHIGTAKALLDQGSEINARNTNMWTPLHDAAYDGNIPMIQLLLSYSADINAKEQSGNTPTAIAVLKGKMATAKFLRDKGGQTHIWRDE